MTNRPCSLEAIPTWKSSITKVTLLLAHTEVFVIAATQQDPDCAKQNLTYKKEGNHCLVEGAHLFLDVAHKDFQFTVEAGSGSCLTKTPSPFSISEYREITLSMALLPAAK